MRLKIKERRAHQENRTTLPFSSTSPLFPHQRHAAEHLAPIDLRPCWIPREWFGGLNRCDCWSKSSSCLPFHRARPAPSFPSPVLSSTSLCPFAFPSDLLKKTARPSHSSFPLNINLHQHFKTFRSPSLPSESLPRPSRQQHLLTRGSLFVFSLSMSLTTLLPNTSSSRRGAGPIWILLNLIRLLSMVSILLVIASTIVLMVSVSLSFPLVLFFAPQAHHLLLSSFLSHRTSKP